MDDKSPIPTASRFEPLLGTDFKVRVEDDRIVNAKLIEVTPLPSIRAREDLPIRKDPFSLIFKVAGETGLEQSMYAVEHETIGTTDMFLVPVGFGEYQVIYN